MTSIRTRAALAAAAGAAVAAAAFGAAVPAQADVPPGHRGRLLSAGPVAGTAALPSAAANRTVAYTSEGADGRPVTVTGTVAIPRGTPPRGGWPVLSWAHGTTGTADVCAPSADTADGPAHDYLAVTERYLDRWVAQGYAVVQTDYEGLGTPGGHPYMHGRSEANAVVDIVRAARGLDRRIGRNWYVAGHSQGGHAALFTAAARQTPRDVRLQGALVLAPGSQTSATPEYVRSGLPGAQAAMPFLFVLLTGAEAADPAIVPDDLLTDEALPMLQAARTSACTFGLRKMAEGFDPTKVFRPDADLGPLVAYLRSQEPTGLTLRVPALVQQGTADTLVSPEATKLLLGDLCERRDAVAYREYEGADHRALLDASFADGLRYVESLRRGDAPPSDC
ncbi:alpha/beta hydrolase family protein [Actinomadura sp. WAC 06369]|uniref:alpha/beta hydrolase family protein n=1 Tax=Actinomadura sp. WAC 06369 TaxID=2203193 RepID=UPI000F7AD1BC|nr:alpha/beta hydrolase [Actinomadura sp. WAC 06369]RSN63782.1 alpha/beta hydrolase [Actinomadura sp. WAC 06369]